jgi:predicted solute-binding protein
MTTIYDLHSMAAINIAASMDSADLYELAAMLMEQPDRTQRELAEDILSANDLMVEAMGDD